MIIYLTTRLCRAVYNAFTKPRIEPETPVEDNPRAKLLKQLVEGRAIKPHWFDTLNDPAVISDVVHVPEFDPNTSEKEYSQIQYLETQLYFLKLHFGGLGGFEEGSKYYDLADFLRIAENAIKGARQHYEQLRFGGGYPTQEEKEAEAARMHEHFLATRELDPVAAKADLEHAEALIKKHTKV